jgi:type II secretory pathway pseudopilin PulG
MDVRAKRSGTCFSRSHGFSMVELAVSLAILMILTGMAIPEITRSLRSYQLNDVASRTADMLKFTRFDAVRRNSQLNLQITQSGNDWIVWTDSFNKGNNGPVDPRDKQLLVTGFATLLPAGGSPGPPSPVAIATALGVSVTALNTNTLSGSNGTVTFDARGAIRVGGTVSSSVFVLYIGSAGSPEFGYRAVILLPAGSAQIWTAPANGTWRQIS